MVCHTAKDHFAYVGAYRKCIDEVEQLKKEMWNIIMDSKAEMYNRIQASRELHNLSKTFVFLLRDLPFVTNLSKFYDKDMLNASHINSVYSKGTYSNKNCMLRIPGSTNSKNNAQFRTMQRWNGTRPAINWLLRDYRRYLIQDLCQAGVT